MPVMICLHKRKLINCLCNDAGGGKLNKILNTLLLIILANLYSMEYAVISVPAAPVRRTPNHRKEMVNQLLFGEMVKILKQKGDLWVKIRSLHDGYEGWLTNTLLMVADEEFANTRSAFVTTDLLGTLAIKDKKIQIPAGSSLPFFNSGKGKLAEDSYTYIGNYRNRDEQKADPNLIMSFANAWLNVPYLWGGRSLLGVDCSGFIQVIYKMSGIDLPRDAWQQAQEGKAVKKLKDALPGDLAFFDNKEDIVHTGILTGNDMIIHASGKVRIDRIDRKGIINSETGKRSLQLKAIRRVL
jgi:cell wall-associated NlpC family hydrolase